LNVILLLGVLAFVVLAILVLLRVISKNCTTNVTKEIPAISGLIIEGFCFIPTVIYGRKILNEMIRKEKLT
jgi:uncharacterized membrane protein